MICHAAGTASGGPCAILDLKFHSVFCCVLVVESRATARKELDAAEHKLKTIKEIITALEKDVMEDDKLLNINDQLNEVEHLCSCTRLRTNCVNIRSRNVPRCCLC